MNTYNIKGDVMEYILNKIYTDTEYLNIINDIITNETVQKMKNFRQHCDTNCFDHCLVASYFCYKFCRKYHLDYISCARAAMLHDLFLYDWRKKQEDKKGLHAFTHPETALKNANEIFDINDVEKDIILKHMWPVTFSFPKYKESFVLTYYDKKCAFMESFSSMREKFIRKRIFRYAYVFFSLLIIL